MAAADDLHRSLERLVGLGQSPDIDIRPVLLRVLADLFIAKPQHPAESLAQFEEIALALFDEADEATRLTVARKLSRHPAVPPALVRRFVGEHGALAAAVLDHAPVEADRLAAATTWGTPEMAIAVARRADLDAHLVELLAERPERDVLRTLLDNPQAPIDRPALRYLVRRVRHDEDLARLALARHDAHPSDLASLFLLADGEQRAAILLAARRDDLGPEMRRPALTAAQLDALQRIERSLMASSRDSLAAALAAALDLSLDQATRIARDERGEPLAVALAAAGASVELAARVFILSGPAIGRSIMAVRTLTATVEALGMRTAARLLAAMTGTSGRTSRRHAGDVEKVRHPRVERDARTVPALEPAAASARRQAVGRAG